MLTHKDKIRELVAHYGSQEMLAAKLGVSYMTIYRWLNDTKPMKIFIRKIDLLHSRVFLKNE